MRKNKIDLTALTKSEVEAIIERANFTDEQLKLFNYLTKDLHYDYALITRMGISSSRYYRIKRIVLDKCERIARELDYKHLVTWM